MKTIAFFNNKGGVGKTTLVCNVAAHMATARSLKVLLVDCDPQCNSTQLLLKGETWGSMYWNPDGKSSQQTLIDLVRPIELGDTRIDDSVAPMRSSRNRFRVDLMPGHPRMSIIEDLLSRSWAEASGGDIGGIRKTNWVKLLREQFEDRYDVLFFDCGPSLGSLNRTVLLGADFFVTPMGADIFSIVGIRNIAEWLAAWLALYDAALDLCETRHPGTLKQFGLNHEVAIRSGFAGYTVQQYITKSKRGVRRPTVAFEKILQDMPAEIEQSLGTFLAPDLDFEQAKLGDVPNMFSLIPLAQSVNAPIAALQAADGLTGGQYRQQLNYAKTIERVSESLARNVDLP